MQYFYINKEIYDQNSKVYNRSNFSNKNFLCVFN